VIARFGAALRAAGLACDVAALEAYATALRNDPDLGPFGVYWYARLTLVRAIEDVPAFDRAFSAFWLDEAPLGDEAVPAAARGAAVAGRAAPGSTREVVVAADPGDRDDGSGEETTADTLVSASDRERLRTRDFANFSDAEWSLAEQLMRRQLPPEAFRRSRRRVIRRHGRRLDVGATLREEQRSFGLRVQPRYRARKRVLRPLVFLCDVSGSMAPYGRALLQYAYVLSQTRPRVATFAFGTQLTDLTDRFQRASRGGFKRALGTIPDWGGGTLIGASLHAFNRRYAMHARVRGATLLLVSDGAERSDPELVGREMRQLARATRRIIWLNPHKRDPAYEPLVRGMAAALPSIDAFLSGHDLRSLAAVAAVIRRSAKELYHA
jgi:uncharacterized protein with von Willebrand factor type A (vWA) domain